METVANHGPRQMYEFFCKDNPESQINYLTFKETIIRFNKKAREMILDGGTLEMGNLLGIIRIKQIKRNFNKPTVNWGETQKLRERGEEGKIYYTDNYYYRWYWSKKRCRVANKTVYSFRPTTGPTGARKALVKRLKNDPLAKTKYLP